MSKTVKKAQVGVAAKSTPTPTLRRGQYKRLGRLAAKSPDRVDRVADRMIERDTRIERGKSFVADKVAKAKADALAPKKQGGSVKKAQLGELIKKYKAWDAKNEADKNYTRKNFKTADSLRKAVPNASIYKKGSLEERKKNFQTADSLERAVEKRVGVPRKKNLYEQKNGGKTKKK